MITFFTTAKPFRGLSAVIQRNALQSWKLVHPDVEVILFGNEAGAGETSRELGLHYVPEVQRSALGAVRANSLFDIAQRIARHDLLCYSNCDIILTRDFLGAVEELRKWRARFLMIGRRWDTDVTAAIDFSRANWQEEIVALAHSTGFQRGYHNIDYFVFPRGLYTGLPPLVVGRVAWDPYLIGRAHTLGVAVVEVSQCVSAVHQNHDYSHLPEGWQSVSADEDAKHNVQLARDMPFMTIEDAPWRLTANGVVSNGLYWLAPAKRRWRDFAATAGGAWRTYLWHPLLNATRPVRRVLGLSQSTIPEALRSSKRRHPMDR